MTAIDPETYEFLTHLVTEVGITDPDLQAQVITDLSDVRYDRVMYGLYEKLSLDQQAFILESWEKWDLARVIAFCKQVLVSFDDIYESIAEEFAIEYLSSMTDPDFQSASE